MEISEPQHTQCHTSRCLPEKETMKMPAATGMCCQSTSWWECASGEGRREEEGSASQVRRTTGMGGGGKGDGGWGNDVVR